VDRSGDGGLIAAGQPGAVEADDVIIEIEITTAELIFQAEEIGAEAGLIQSLSPALLPGLSGWVDVGGIASSLCSKARPPQPIST